MMDKSVATDGDFQGEGEWKRVQLESLLAALVDSKVVAMKADNSYIKYYRPPPKLPKHHHHHRHCRHKDRSRSKSALRKVRQWDDGTGMRVGGEERYVTLDMDDDDSESYKRKRRKRKRMVGPMLHRPPIVAKPKIVDPEDLPKRARWTIIITAGFLLLTCMLLVGITLRMAPIIDQMVHNQNEELMNSLHRQDDFNDSLNIMMTGHPNYRVYN
uniref:Putative conserved plasma membrane protein n=1 Tax=Triatoma infestans TaxID=30076 RepID=A0A023EZG6_TRIIF